MRAVVEAWCNATSAVVAEHAPEYEAEFKMGASPNAVSFEGFRNDQSAIIGSFDVIRERLPPILRELRRK